MLNLGSINFGLSADTTGLASSVAQVQKFGDTVTSTVTKAKGSINDTTTALIRQESALISTLQQVQNMSNAIKNAQVAPSQQVAAIQQLEQAYANLASQMTASLSKPLNSLDFGRSMAGFKEQVDSVNRSMQTAKTQGSDPFVNSMRGLTAAVILMDGPFGGIAYRISATTSLMREYGVVAGGVAAALAGMAAAALALGESVAKSIISYQSANQALVAVTGNTQVASAEFMTMVGVANQAGLSVQGLQQNFTRFIASATGSGETLGLANTQFKQFALIAGNLHLSTQDAANAMRAFDQMLSSGRVQGQELRSLFRDMPAVYEIANSAANKMGVDLNNALKTATLSSQDFLNNFLNIGTQMLHINMDQPVNTLMAALQRLQTSWFMFNKSIADALGASDTFTSVINGLAAAINFLTTNVTTVLRIVGAFVGAIAGLLATMAIVSVVTTFIGLITTLGTVLAATAGSTGILAAAMLAVQTVMMDTPIGLIITGLGLLAGAVLGATAGYNSMKSMITANNIAMTDLTGLTSYVSQLETTKTQVRSVTAEILKMNAAQLLTNAKSLGDYASKVQGMTDQYNDYSSSVNSSGVNFNETPSFYMGPSDKDLEDASANLKAMQAKVQQQQALVNQLNSLMTVTPEQTSKPNYKPPTKDIDKSLKSIEGIILAANQAQTALAGMYAGPANDLLVKSLTSVQEKLFDLDPTHLAEINRLLGLPPGTALSKTTEQLTEMDFQAKLAQQTLQNFNKVWNDIQKGQATIAGVNEQIAYLRQGGDPDQMWIVEASMKANEQIAKLQDGAENLQNTLSNLRNAKGQQVFDQGTIDSITKLGQTDSAAALEATRKALADLGYTGDTAKTALTNFFATMGQGQDQLSKLNSVMSQLKKSTYDFYTAQEELSAANSGGSQSSILDIGYLRQAQQQLEYLSNDSLAAVVTKLEALGIAGTTATEMMANFDKQQAQMQTALGQWKKVIDDQVSTWTTFSDSALDDLDKILEGTESFSVGVKNILANLAHAVLEAAIFDPLKNGIKNAISSALYGTSTPGGFGIGQAIGSIFGLGGGDAGMSAATVLVNTGGFIKKFAGGGTASGPIFGPGGPMDDRIPAMLSNGEFVINAAQTKKYMSLLMAINSGKTLHLANGGIAGYVPNSSGSGSNSNGQSPRGDIIIDASVGSIIAPGADAAALGALQQEIAARDQRLRADIPYMIDNRYMDSKSRGRYGRG